MIKIARMIVHLMKFAAVQPDPELDEEKVFDLWIQYQSGKRSV